MNVRRGVFAVLAALIPVSVGCNSVLGIKDHALVDGGAAGTGGSGTAGGGGTAGAGGTAGTGGTSAICNVDGSVADGEEVPTGIPSCGFVMPNFVGDLPNQPNYTVNTDQTVTDNVTKLTWEGIVDNRTVPQSEAARYCAQKEQSNGPWRLPTLLELLSLVDFTISTPGPTISAMFPDRPSTLFWTSSRAACGVPKGWYVDFARGDAHQSVDNTLLRVRCVRGALPNCPPNRYSFPGDGTVHDAATGLTWWRTVAVTQDLTWADATALCPTLGNGWRLPSPAELETIVDLTRENPPIDWDAFPGTPAEYFWTATPQAGDSNYSWYVAFVHGHIDTVEVGQRWWVRCVRWDGL